MRTTRREQTSTDDTTTTTTSRARAAAFVEWAFWGQVAANIIALCVVIAVMFQVNADSAQRSIIQSRSNGFFIQELVTDLTIHGRADTNRTCAIARELEFLIRQSPEVKPRVIRRVEEFTVAACTFVPPQVSSSQGP
jgi:hypothetical protein